MKTGETEYLGGGAYLHFNGYGFEIRANHHENPTDKIYVEGSGIPTLLRLIRETIEDNAEK